MHLKVEEDLQDGVLGKSPAIGGFSSASLFHSLTPHFPIHIYSEHSFQLEVSKPAEAQYSFWCKDYIYIGEWQLNKVSKKSWKQWFYLHVLFYLQM